MPCCILRLLKCILAKCVFTMLKCGLSGRTYALVSVCGQAGDVVNVQIVEYRGGHDAYVKDLMWLEHVVTLAREVALGHAGRIQKRAADVEQGHQQDFQHRRLVVYREEPVAKRKDNRQAKCHKDRCPKGPESGRRELAAERHHGHEDTTDRYQEQIKQFKWVIAVKGIVDPGHETTRS